MPNRLAGSTSPYLLQHKDNPVDWWEWGPEAFAEARRRDVPILLSVGYAACHWCHVMAHESFEDEAHGGLLNERFVAVKVDREERPDVDAVYMEATQALTGSGGWPMTVFVDHDGRPSSPAPTSRPQPRPGMPSFRQLLAAVSDAWVIAAPTWLHRCRDAHPGRAGPAPAASTRTAPDRSGRTCDAAVRAPGAPFDDARGGFGGAPKFPPSMVLEFLLRHHARTGEPPLGCR